MEDGVDPRGEVHPVSVAMPAPVAPLWTVQVMRGAAALMIVIGHSQSAVASVKAASGAAFVRSMVIPWGAGVDLFFVISGFIMVHTSGRLFGRAGARRTFLRRRIMRIVPLYWIVTSGFLALLAAAALKGGDTFPGARAIVASYAFVPADTYGQGQLFPVFDLGWTLNYEMFFYALFALVIVWTRKRALAALGVMLVMLVLAGSVIPGPSAAWFWTRPIILEFGLGVVVGAMVAHSPVLPTPLRLLLAGLGVTILLADPLHVFGGLAGTTVANAWPRVLLAGIPVAAVLAAALLGGEPRMPRVALPFTRVGDASYSLYLFHPVALIALEKLAQKQPVVAQAPGWLLVAGTVLAALGLAFATWRYVERPLTGALAAASLARKEKLHGTLSPAAAPADRPA